MKIGYALMFSIALMQSLTSSSVLTMLGVSPPPSLVFLTNDLDDFMYSEHYPEFVTVTCNEWKPVLSEDRLKEVIVESFRFLTREGRILLYAFVIMETHFHMIWQIMGKHEPDTVQRDFLKFTSQQILKLLRNDKAKMYDELIVDARDRRRQVWKRDSLGIPLWSPKVFDQKLDYIHYNAVEAGLCQYPEEYKYSSASFYILNSTRWEFLTHADE